MTQKIYALLVGINEYPGQNKLYGCINDVGAIKEYLHGYYSNEEDYDSCVKMITNEAATRENIMSTFLDHFKQLESGDTALFYYSGHGDSFEKPVEIYDSNGNEQCQSIVCNFRGGERKDIADKELGAMIDDVTTEKDVFFLVITDCCHSGTITRNDDVSIRAYEKSDANSYKHLPVSEYYGYDKASKNENNQYVFKWGKHMHIAACQDKEKALETSFKRKRHGVLTYNLLLLLEQNKGDISYTNLEEQSRIIVSKTSPYQHTKLNNHTGNIEANQMQFLNRTPVNISNAAAINYINGDWQLNRGLLHNVSIDDRVLLKTGSNGEWDAKVEKVMLSHSLLSIRNSSIKGKREEPNIPVLISETAQHFIEIKFTVSVPDTIKEQIKQSHLFNRLPYYKILEDMETYYNIDYNEEKEELLFNSSIINTPLIGPMPVLDLDKFLIDICKYSKAMYIWQLGNITTGYHLRNDYSLKLFVKNAGEINFDEHKNLAADVQFNFNQHEASPQYKIKMTNTGDRLLFIQHLFIDCLYGISNIIFNGMELEPGTSKWLQVAEPGPSLSSEISEIFLTDAVLNRGWKKVQMQLKLIITTQPLGTAGFVQSNIDVDLVTPVLITRRAEEEWRVENLTFVIKAQYNN